MEVSFFLAMTVFMSAKDDKFHRVARELCLCGIGNLHCLAFSQKAASCCTKQSTVACASNDLAMYRGFAALGTNARPDKSALGQNS